MPHWHARVQADNVDEVGDGNLRAPQSASWHEARRGGITAARPPMGGEQPPVAVLLLGPRRHACREVSSARATAAATTSAGVSVSKEIR